MAKDFVSMYKDKLRTPEQIAQLIEPGDWIDYGFFNGKPVACDKAIAARKNELSDIKIVAAVTVPPIPEVVLQDPKGEVFTYMDLHFSMATRIMQERCGGVFYHPLCFGEAEKYFHDGWHDVDNVGSIPRKAHIMQVAPMDKEGFFNWGLHNAVTYSQARAAHNVIVEVNQKVPVALGGALEKIHVSEVTYIVEGDNPDLAELPPVEPTIVDRQIATHVMEHLKDGACIQLGIGAMPNVLGKMINDTDLKDLGGHTEMLVEAFMHLWESGKMNGRKKNIDTGRISYTFALGNKELYDWIDNNTGLASYNVGHLLHPVRLSQLDNLISINQALQVDLYSQVNAESAGFRQISGNGGMTDFVLGAYWSKGGRSLICLPSTRTAKDGRVISNIVPAFDVGSITTIPRQMVNMIVTEYGWVSLKGTSTWARAEKLISIAHPDFKDELIKAAEERKIWRNSNKIS
ncbi:MAG: acetyl-CoA hydrolase/transferase family protein [Acidobacteriota bacterium]